MNNEKYYEGWNKGKDLTPDDLVVLPKEKGYNIYLRFGAPYPYYPQEVEKRTYKIFCYNI